MGILLSGSGDAHNREFTIDGDQLKINDSPDYESQYSYNIRVQTTDAIGEIYQEDFTINVNDVGPTALSLSNNSIDEKVVADTVVGTFFTDPDPGNTFTYELVSGSGDADNGEFTIDGDQLKINDSPDHGTQSRYSIRVRTTDSLGESYEERLIINVNDITAPRVKSFLYPQDNDTNIEIEPGAIQDISGNDYAGISCSTR